MFAQPFSVICIFSSFPGTQHYHASINKTNEYTKKRDWNERDIFNIAHRD